MASTDEVNTFLYDRLIVDIIHCLNDYIDNGRGTLEELIGSFRGSLPEEVRRRVQDVAQLVNALEEQSVIGKNNVKIIKLLAEKIGLQALVEKINEYEYDVSGFITKMFKGGAGAVKTSAIHLKAVLSCRGVQATVLTAAVLGVYGMNPETVQNFQPFLDLRARLLELFPGSVVFVLKVSSIASIKQLWKGYKDGSLKKKLKKALNEMKELKELSKGEEIDVEETIDEDEYREEYWNLILSEVKAIKAKKEASEDTATELKEVINMVEQEEKGQSEIRQELSELNIGIDATGFEKLKVEGKAELTAIQDKVKRTDLGASTSFPAEEVEKITAVIENSLEEPNYDNHPTFAITLNNSGLSYRELGQHNEAQKCYERALAIEEKAYDQDPHLATTLNNLGVSYNELGRHKEAQKCLERALAIQEKAYDQDHPTLATTLNNLGNNFYSLGHHKEAQKCLERALAIQEKAYDQDHPTLATTLNNLGVSYNELGRHKEAQKCLERTLAIQEKAYDQDHPTLATTLNNLGNNYLTLGQHNEAQKCYERALAIREKAYDQDHPTLATTLNNLGNNFYSLGQHKEAQKCYKRALAIREKAYDQDHRTLATTMNNLGVSYTELGRHKEAQECYERALAIQEKAYDQDHPFLATILSNLGNNFYSLGHHNEAQKCIERALAM